MSKVRLLRSLGLTLAIAMACRRQSDLPRKPAIAAPALPSLARDIGPVFQRACASEAGCHGDEPSKVKLDLRPPAIYEQLVGHAAVTRKGALRVKPGDPGESVLVVKLQGPLRASEGKLMPIDANTGAPIIPNPLGAAFIDNTLVPWIAAGAPNN